MILSRVGKHENLQSELVYICMDVLGIEEVNNIVGDIYAKQWMLLLSV